MPYEYRNMTPEERAEIVRLRRERGYPLHSPPHPFRHAGCYLLTTANFEHADIMASPDRRTNFESRLLDSMRDIHADVLGWVILPNHYHILVCVKSLDWMSAALKQLHGTTSREWNIADQKTGARRVWYKFRDRMIRNDPQFYQALNYVHINPVKHGYVSKPEEWLWSSVHNYFETRGRDWLRRIWKTYPPGNFGMGWDD